MQIDANPHVLPCANLKMELSSCIACSQLRMFPSKGSELDELRAIENSAIQNFRLQDE